MLRDFLAASREFLLKSNFTLTVLPAFDTRMSSVGFGSACLTIVNNKIGSPIAS